MDTKSALENTPFATNDELGLLLWSEGGFLPIRRALPNETDDRAAQLRKSPSASFISAAMMALSASESVRPAIRKIRSSSNADMFLVNRNEIGDSVSKLPCLRLGKGAFF